MTKYMLTATALVLILMVMWLPARTPPEIFEETALREALMLRTGEGIPMPETAANLAVEYLDGLVWVSGVPDRYTLRPYGGSPMTKDEFAEIGRAAERTTQTEWLRAMKSLFVMATQRLAVMTAGTIALMPFILALIVDGFVRRRIREAEYHAPSPTWWTASLSLQLLAVCLGIVAIMHPNYPPQWLSVFPVAFALNRGCKQKNREDGDNSDDCSQPRGTRTVRHVVWEDARGNNPRAPTRLWKILETKYPGGHDINSGKHCGAG